MRKELKILNSVSSMSTIATGLLGPIYAVFVKGIGGDLITAGIAYSIFMIMSGLSILVLSRWEDRREHKELILVVGYGIACIGFLGYIFVENPIQLFVVSVILGVGSAIRTPLFDAIYSINLDSGKYASQWGVWESLNMIFTGISAFLGGAIAEIYGFQSLFIVMLALSLIGFGLSTSLLVMGPEGKKRRIRQH